MKNFINPNTPFPLPKVQEQLVFLNQFIEKDSRVYIGDFTYYHDINDARLFQKNNILYHHPALEDELHIGKFCSIAMGTRFLMSGAMHLSEGSTYPFEVFMPEIVEHTGRSLPYQKRSSTVVGNDVWFGLESVIMPGIQIGNGAIIGTRAVVTKDVPPYSVVVGNPANIIKYRYSMNIIKRFEQLCWWDWPTNIILKNIKSIVNGDINVLENAQQVVTVSN